MVDPRAHPALASSVGLRDAWDGICEPFVRITLSDTLFIIRLRGSQLQRLVYDIKEVPNTNNV